VGIGRLQLRGVLYQHRYKALHHLVTEIVIPFGLQVQAPGIDRQGADEFRRLRVVEIL
jgi:hypothetical protein